MGKVGICLARWSIGLSDRKQLKAELQKGPSLGLGML